MALSISNHMGVIDFDIWLKCQYKLQNNTQIKNTSKGKHTFLTGLVKCGYCGYGMSVKLYKNTKYLCCTGRYITNKCIEKLETHYAEDIEAYVFKEMILFVKDFKDIDASDINNKDSEINSLKIEVHKIQEEIENFINNLSRANEVLSKYVNNKIVDLDNRKNELLNKISEHNLSRSIIKMPNLDNFQTLDNPTKNSICKNIIDKVLVLNDSINIKWHQ